MYNIIVSCKEVHIYSDTAINNLILINLHFYIIICCLHIEKT